MIAADLVALESELRSVMLAGDAAALQLLLDDDLARVLPTGAGRADDRASYRTRRMHLTQLQLLDQQVMQLGTTAVVSALLELAGEYDGVRFGGPFRYTRVWEKREQSWCVVAGHVDAATGFAERLPHAQEVHHVRADIHQVRTDMSVAP